MRIPKQRRIPASDSTKPECGLFAVVIAVDEKATTVLSIINFNSRKVRSCVSEMASGGEKSLEEMNADELKQKLVVRSTKNNFCSTIVH